MAFELIHTLRRKWHVVWQPTTEPISPTFEDEDAALAWLRAPEQTHLREQVEVELVVSADGKWRWVDDTPL